jgi:hypothetical protein
VTLTVTTDRFSALQIQELLRHDFIGIETKTMTKKTITRQLDVFEAKNGLFVGAGKSRH